MLLEFDLYLRFTKSGALLDRVYEVIGLYPDITRLSFVFSTLRLETLESPFEYYFLLRVCDSRNLPLQLD